MTTPLPTTAFFPLRDPAVQRALLRSAALYLLILAVSVSAGSTVLLALGLTAYIITPLLLGSALAHSPTLTMDRSAKAAAILRWLAATAVCLTAALYVVADVWNPDRFSYPLGELPFLLKLLQHLQFQLPWILLSIPLGLLPLLLKPRRQETSATAQRP